MSAKLEKSVVLLLLVILFVAVANTLVLQGFSLTKEEAIEISRDSDTVRSRLEGSDNYSVEVHYMNSTEVNNARERFPSDREIYPENRSIWTVTWSIHAKGTHTGALAIISHVVDAETGQILYEGLMGTR